MGRTVVEEAEPMIREERFVLSRGQYAIDLDSYDPQEYFYAGGPAPSQWATFEAVWYRRTKGRTKACYGLLTHHFRFRDVMPEDPEKTLSLMVDGRYGGTCLTRWDGESLWTDRSHENAMADLEILKPMLESVPSLPAGYTGWYRYPKPGER